MIGELEDFNREMGIFILEFGIFDKEFGVKMGGKYSSVLMGTF